MSGAPWAAVLCRGFAGAKRRLAPVLGEAERAALARTMLADVLTALAATPGLAGIAVVSGDAEVWASARAFGARVLDDPASAGPSAAAARAARALPGALIVLPADVPLVTASEIARLIAAIAAPPALALVPARADGGTNALAAAPAATIPFAFGRASFARHHALARARGIAPSVLALPGLGHDLDRPADLARLLAGPATTRTQALLAGLAPRRVA